MSTTPIKQVPVHYGPITPEQREMLTQASERASRRLDEEFIRRSTEYYKQTEIYQKRMEAIKQTDRYKKHMEALKEKEGQQEVEPCSERPCSEQEGTSS